MVDKLVWTTKGHDIREFNQKGYVILFEGKNAKKFLEELI